MKTCVVCGERADCYLDGHLVCKHCRALADRDDAEAQATRATVDAFVARRTLAHRYPSIAKKLRGES